MPSDPIVTTRAGRVEGRRRRGVAVFRGIPYARPPRGALRWRPPEPVRPWSGVRGAREFGPSAPQSAPVMLLVRSAVGGARRQSQDCLYLNVWTPDCDAARRPVLVWIHGGAFLLGSGSAGLYDGADLVRRGDVVVVTLNYRLGALGFLDLHERFPGRAVANAGLRDQVAALRWVRDNVEAFGGDPENVTIFGESAGAMSVGTLLGTPAAQGLFRRAICQSGAAHNVSTPAEAARVAEHYLAELGIDDFAGLERASVSRLLAAQRRTTLALGLALGGLPWQPSVDGDVLPVHPLDAIGKGAARDVPVLVGTNRDEWKLFTLGDRKARRMDDERLRRRLARALPGRDRDGRALAERAHAAYRAFAEDAGWTLRDAWEAFQSDRIFHHPAQRLARVHAAQAGAMPGTWAYLFGWSPPGLRGSVGACHGLEIPFVFGTLHDPLLRPFTAFAVGARKLSQRMQDAWVAFARHGDPAHDGLPDWPAFDAERRAVLLWSRRTRVEESPFAARMRFWDALEAERR